MFRLPRKCCMEISTEQIKHKNLLCISPRYNTGILHCMPWVSIFLSTLILCYWALLLQIDESKSLWKISVCTKSMLNDGELWRFFLYAFPHLNIRHLLLDVLYLIVVGTLSEILIGRSLTLACWLLCCLGGSLTFLVFDPVASFAYGSSSATHGLLAAVSMWLLLSSRDSLINLACAVTVVYQVFTSIYAMLEGVMPITLIPSTGYAHLGGIVCGLVFGFLLFCLLRNRSMDGLRTLC